MQKQVLIFAFLALGLALVSAQNSTNTDGCSATSTQCTNYLGIDYCCAKLTLQGSSTNSTVRDSYNCLPRNALTTGSYTLFGQTYTAQCTFGVMQTVSIIAFGVMSAVAMMI